MDDSLTPSLILIVEDHPFSRLGVAVALKEAGYKVLEADNAQTGMELAIEHRPQGAIIDIEIPSAPEKGHPDPDCGIGLGRQLKEKFPQMGIVFLSAYLEYARNVFDLLFRAKQGLAYQHKANRTEQLLAALEMAMNGKIVIESSILIDSHPIEDSFVKSLAADESVWVERAERNLSRGVLSKREKEVAQRIAWSQTREGIRLALCISPETVDAHITNIYAKLGLDEIDKSTQLRKDILLAKAFTLYQLRHQDERFDRGGSK